MNDREVFERLFKLAKDCKDPEGVVMAALVEGGKIILYSSSADDGVRHVEDLLFEKARKQNIKIGKRMTLFVTLEPCSYRSPENKVKDCTSIILNTVIKNGFIL